MRDAADNERIRVDSGMRNFMIILFLTGCVFVVLVGSGCDEVKQKETPFYMNRESSKY
jgi:hypothetical protein